MKWYNYITNLQRRIDKDCNELDFHTNGFNFAHAKGKPFYTTSFYQGSVTGFLVVAGDTGCAMYAIPQQPWAWYDDIDAEYLARKCVASESGRRTKQWYGEKYQEIARSAFSVVNQPDLLDARLSQINDIADAEQFYNEAHIHGIVDYDGLSIDNGYAPSVDCMYHATMLRRIGIYK
jgi:hypothetical protein